MNGCYYLLFMDILFLVKVFSFEILRLCSLKTLFGPSESNNGKEEQSN